MTMTPQAPMADVGEMYAVHTMLRREFSLLPGLIRGADRDDAQRRFLIGAHVQLVCQILHTHHEGEDLVLWPLLLERAGFEAMEIVPAMQDQHFAIAAAHDEAVHRLGEWCKFGRDGEGFAMVFDELVRVLTEHTALEEVAVASAGDHDGAICRKIRRQELLKHFQQLIEVLAGLGRQL